MSEACDLARVRRIATLPHLSQVSRGHICGPVRMTARNYIPIGYARASQLGCAVADAQCVQHSPSLIVRMCCQWALETKEMDTMMRAVDKLTPNASKRKKHHPYTIEFMSALRAHLDLASPWMQQCLPAS